MKPKRLTAFQFTDTRALTEAVLPHLQQVRQACERVAPKIGFADNLSCMCAIASRALAEYLSETAGYQQVTVRWGKFFLVGKNKPQGDHCWVEFCGHVLDLTATQFSTMATQPHVILTKAEAIKTGYRFHKSMVWQADKLSLFEALISCSWPTDQVPTTQAINKIMRQACKRSSSKPSLTSRVHTTT